MGDFDYFGFSYGSLKVLTNGVIETCLGDFLKDKQDKLVYIFADPSIVKDVFT